MQASLVAPFELDPAQLRCVALALNSPVVAVDPLSAGPAQAAIAVHATGGAALVIRTQRSGAVAWIDAAGGDEAQAFERALAWAEGLGFLFEQEDFEAEAGLAQGAWPAWLRELFAEPGRELVATREATTNRDASGWLSKFRWALPESA